MDIWKWNKKARKPGIAIFQPFFFRVFRVFRGFLL
jgi:hypothetical protein